MYVETIRIAGIDTPVSRIALGTWSMGGHLWGGADNEQATRTLRHALALGINLIDTAPVYGFGLSEQMIGKALRGVRHSAVIATQAGLHWDDGPPRCNATARRIRKALEDSLVRLDTDYIDLYQIHWPDSPVAQEETADELERLRREGKILAVGVSNYASTHRDTFSQHTAAATVQPPYNRFERSIDSAILPYARQHCLVVLAYGPLCRGLLSGNLHAQPLLPGTLCARSTRHSRRRVSSNTWKRWPRWVSMRASATANRCWPWPCVGCSTKARPSRCGEPGVPSNCAVLKKRLAGN